MEFRIGKRNYKRIVFRSWINSLTITILLVLGQYSYSGFGNISLSSLLVWFGAYFMQSTAEEIMCRGFIQTSLARKVKKHTAILISSFVFAFPHIATIVTFTRGKGILFFVAIINLFLVSILLSVAMISGKTIGLASGIHIGWNYCLGTIFGLEVSGGNVTNSIFKFILQSDNNILTGGIYGVEASILLIPICSICIVLFVWNIKRSKLNGI